VSARPLVSKSYRERERERERKRREGRGERERERERDRHCVYVRDETHCGRKKVTVCVRERKGL
jgi:hypothetical protein